MDQYFERLNQAAENPQMPRRIQFMIQDLVDMRRNRWLPRKIGAGSEGPRTIQQIREDAYRDGGIYLPQQSPPSSSDGGGHLGKRHQGGHQGHHGGSAFINPLERGFFDSGSGGGGRKGNDDLFALGVGIAGFGSNSPYLGTGPGAIPGYGESVSPTPPSMSREPQSAPPALNGFNKGGDRRGSEEGGRRDSRSPPSAMHDRDGPRGERPKGQQQPPHRGSPVDGGGGGRAGGGALPPRMMNKDRANDTRENRDRGGHFLGSDRGDDPADFTPRHLPALDFGDRYSANRSKDRERRERFGGQGVGGAFKETRFGDDGGRFGDGGGPSRDFGIMSDSRLPPRFKKMVLSNQQQQPQHQQPTGGQYHQGQAPMSQPPHLQQTLQGPPPPKPPSMQSSAPSRNSGGGGEVSLRPQGASNMLFKPKTPSMLPKSAISSSEGSSPLGENSLNRPAPTMQQMGGKVVMMRQQEPAIILKQSSHLDKQGRNKEKNKQKGPTR